MEYNHYHAIFAAWLSAYAYSQRVARYLQSEWFFDHTEEFNYDSSPHRDTAAHTIAHNNNLVIAAIRGTPRGRDEWLSNLDMGFGKHHTGFMRATSDVYHNLSSYMSRHGLMGKTMLITGHSRGGAIANLLGERISKAPLLVSKGGLYVYTYGAPMVSRSDATGDSIHNNIFNIINLHDPVVHVPLHPHRRYGQDLDFSWLNRDPFYSHMIIETYIAWLVSNPEPFINGTNPSVHTPFRMPRLPLYK